MKQRATDIVNPGTMVKCLRDVLLFDRDPGDPQRKVIASLKKGDVAIFIATMERNQNLSHGLLMTPTGHFAWFWTQDTHVEPA